MEINIPMKSMGAPRPRFASGHAYMPKTYKDYRAELGRWIMRNQPLPFYAKDISLLIDVTFAMPKSWSKKKRDQMDGSYHCQKPDVDNIIKPIMDELTGIVYADDASVFDIGCRKKWGIEDNIRIVIGGRKERSE